MKCKCGHAGDLHTPLPMHPDGFWECYGSDDCECGQFEAASGLDRARIQLARSSDDGEFAVRDLIRKRGLR